MSRNDERAVASGRILHATFRNARFPIAGNRSDLSKSVASLLNKTICASDWERLCRSVDRLVRVSVKEFSHWKSFIEAISSYGHTLVHTHEELFLHFRVY